MPTPGALRPRGEIRPVHPARPPVEMRRHREIAAEVLHPTQPVGLRHGASGPIAGSRS